MAGVVGKAGAHPEPAVHVGLDDGVARHGGAGDVPLRAVGLHADPLPAVRHVLQPVGIGDRASVRRQRLTDLRRARDRRCAGRRAVLRGGDRVGAGARAAHLVAGVVGEAGAHRQRLADIRRDRRVAGRGPDGNRVPAPEPLPRIRHARQPVGVGDGARAGRQRRAHPRRARDRGRAGGGAVGP